MKLAILSDIHANASALQAVLAAAENKNVDMFLIAGDLIGYYFQPAVVIDMLRDLGDAAHIIRGNHEDLFLQALEKTKPIEQTAWTADPGMMAAIHQLNDNHIDFIKGLPDQLDLKILDQSILLCHGSPDKIDAYLYPDSNLEHVVASLTSKPQALILGHTHYPMCRDVGGILVLNPGSVGQPRNRAPGAHWALLDLHTLEVQPRIENYDIERLAKQCGQDYPEYPYLSEVLLRR